MKNIVGKKVEIAFLDHNSDDNATIGRSPQPNQMILSLTGWVLAEDKDYYLVESVRCNVPGNCVTWSVLKAVVVDIKEVS